MKLYLKIFLFIILFFLSDFLVAFALQKGMEKYYGLNKSSKILCVGHSHTVLGIDTKQIENELSIPVAKYAVAGANIVDRYSMIKHFIGLNPDVKIVIYDVDARLFDTEGLSSASYTLFLPFIDNDSIDEYIKKEATWQEYVLSKIIRTSRFRDQSFNIAIRGIFGKAETLKKTKVNINNYKNYLEKERKKQIRINIESVKKFKETIDFLSKKNIIVYLINIPVIDKLNEIDPENQKKSINIFRKISNKHDNVVFLDYSPQYEKEYDLFFDLRHLNNKGKQIVTQRLLNDLNLDVY